MLGFPLIVRISAPFPLSSSPQQFGSALDSTQLAPVMTFKQVVACDAYSQLISFLAESSLALATAAKYFRFEWRDAELTVEITCSELRRPMQLCFYPPKAKTELPLKTLASWFAGLLWQEHCSWQSKAHLADEVCWYSGKVPSLEPLCTPPSRKAPCLATDL